MLKRVGFLKNVRTEFAQMEQSPCLKYVMSYGLNLCNLEKKLLNKQLIAGIN